MQQRSAGISRYSVVDLRNGFGIGAANREFVQIQLNRFDFEVSSDGDSERVPLIEFRRLVSRVASRLMKNWTPPRDDRKPFPGIKSWAMGKTRAAIAGRIHGPWRRLLQRVDPRVLAVQRAVFAATFGTAQVTQTADFYRNRYLVDDVIRFRAAAVAAREATFLATRKRRNQIMASPLMSEFQTIAEELQCQVNIRAEVQPVDQAVALSSLADWPGLFSRTDAYSSLRKTLMNLPGGVAGKLLLNLPGIRLPRPIYRRLELMLVLLFAEQPNQLNRRVIHFATEDQIRRALGIVGRGIGRRLTARGSDDLQWLVYQLGDYPEPHSGNLVGLARKLVKYQQAERKKRIESVIQEYGSDNGVAKPPIDLPDQPGVSFLDSPARICFEGVRMNHCVETLIPAAIRGEAYLFHVDHKNQMATVQVDNRGRLIQVSGPSNRPNSASKWAAACFRSWGRRLRAKSAHAIPAVRGGGHFQEVVVPF